MDIYGKLLTNIYFQRFYYNNIVAFTGRLLKHLFILWILLVNDWNPTTRTFAWGWNPTYQQVPSLSSPPHVHAAQRTPGRHSISLSAAVFKSHCRPSRIGGLKGIFRMDGDPPQYIGYPLVNMHITMERSTIFYGNTHYFYGHFQYIAMLNYQRIISIPPYNHHSRAVAATAHMETFVNMWISSWLVTPFSNSRDEGDMSAQRTKSKEFVFNLSYN